MITTLVIANHKGGVGKTTTAVTLASGLADLGYHVVLIDCDPQGNVAQFLGLDRAPGLYELIVARRSPAEVARPVEGYQNLAIIPGDETTADVETLLRTSSRFRPATVLRDALAPLARNGRGGRLVVVLDTAPSLSSVQVAALSAADWLLIPASPEYASKAGITGLVNAVAELRETGANLNLLGILPTMFITRSREHNTTLVELRAAFPNLILPPVRNLVALREAPGYGLPIWTYQPGSEAALDYAAVLKEVIGRVGL